MEGYYSTGYKLFFILFVYIVILYGCIHSELLILESSLALSPKVKNAMVGDLLGDGHLRYSNKNKYGHVTGNCLFSMTLRDKEYALFLWGDIYKDICTSTPPHP
jgi:hypothetical protein